MTCSSFPLLLCVAALISILPSSRAAGECSLCGDDNTVHDDHQQILLFVSEHETYTTCTDLAMALLETADDSSHCLEIQKHFATSCCTTHEITSIHRRASWNTAATASWNTPPSTPVGSASTSWGGWGQSPAKPVTTPIAWNTNNQASTPFSFPTTQTVLSSFNNNVVKPTVGWWTNRQPAPAPITTPIYVVPSYTVPAPAPKPQYTNPNVVLSDHPAWGQNTGATASKVPGLTYLNDGFCGICTDPSNGSLGIVVDGFGLTGFSFRGTFVPNLATGPVSHSISFSYYC